MNIRAVALKREGLIILPKYLKHNWHHWGEGVHLDYDDDDYENYHDDDDDDDDDDSMITMMILLHFLHTRGPQTRLAARAGQ